MELAMVIEIWERLRGYHKWTPAQARVEFLKEDQLYHGPSGKDLHDTHVTGSRLLWIDSRGVHHHAMLRQSGDPAKYPLTDGETVDLRYNPANPEQFYSCKLSEMKVRRFFANTSAVIAVAAISIGCVWLREMFGCSR